jgi:tRNA-dihydrouridine synthase
MVEAARIVEQARPDILDINFGCPVKRVAGKGAGAGMLQNIPKMLEITRAVADAVKIPVTVKTRLGWDAGSKIIVDLAEQLQDCGIAALTIHGRSPAVALSRRKLKAVKNAPDSNNSFTASNQRIAALSSALWLRVRRSLSSMLS